MLISADKRWTSGAIIATSMEAWEYILWTIVAGLAVAVLLAVARPLCRSIRRRWQRRKPVTITAERVTHNPSWGVAFADALPDPAAFQEAHPRSADEAHEWLIEQGGVDYLSTRLRLTLHNRTDEQIRVDRIRLDLERLTPLSGASVVLPSQGENEDTLLAFDLDADPPVAWRWKGDSGNRVDDVPYFDCGHVDIEPSKTHIFTLVCHTGRCRARWRPLVEFTIESHSKTLSAGNEEQWFDTSGDPPDGFADEYQWNAWADWPRFERRSPVRFVADDELN